MKKSLFSKMAAFADLNSSPDISPCDVDVMPVDLPTDIGSREIKDVLSEIFGVDELTGLPKGDLAYYLSGSGNPAVKQWIENNLLSVMRPRNQNSEGLSDDDILEFSRGADESGSAYFARVQSMYNDAVAASAVAAGNSE